MSLWFERKDKTGRPHLWQIDVEPLVIVLPIGLLAAIVLPELALGGGRLAEIRMLAAVRGQ